MVYLGRARYSPKTGLYVPLIVAENVGLQDGDLVEFHIEDQELILRKSAPNKTPLMDPENLRRAEGERRAGR